jgi:hypothetical protein
MRSLSRIERRADAASAGSPAAGPAGVSARHRLLTDSWTADVEALESAIDRIRPQGTAMNNCDVVCFEIEGDRHLHVNVTHRYTTKPVKGWAGSGVSPDGFVHNRLFAMGSTERILHDIRRMVFAPRA